MSESPREALFRRVLLKLSGEALMGERGHGIDPAVVDALSDEVVAIRALEVELAIVIGGGNIFRGLNASAQGMERVTADHMGMLATVINALALQDGIERKGIQTRLLSAIEMRAIAEPYIRRRAVRHLERGRVVIFAAGTGNPFFTTDTAAALRANEVGADAFLHATQIDDIYTADPRKDPDAQLLREIGYQEALERQLRVMDATAFSLCMENRMPIHVFDLGVRGNVLRVLRGEPVGSVVR
jgi:uridylate kinase